MDWTEVRMGCVQESCPPELVQAGTWAADITASWRGKRSLFLEVLWGTNSTVSTVFVCSKIRSRSSIVKSYSLTPDNINSRTDRYCVCIVINSQDGCCLTMLCFYYVTGFAFYEPRGSGTGILKKRKANPRIMAHSMGDFSVSLLPRRFKPPVIMRMPREKIRMVWI